MSAADVEQSIGRHSSEVGGVVVHRDDLVMTSGRKSKSKEEANA